MGNILSSSNFQPTSVKIHRSGLTRSEFSPNNNWIVSWDQSEQYIKLHNLHSMTVREARWNRAQLFSYRLFEVAFSDSSIYLYAIYGASYNACYIVTWDIQSGKLVSVDYNSFPIKQIELVTKIAFFDQSTISVYCYNVNTDIEIKTFPLSKQLQAPLSFSKKCRTVRKTNTVSIKIGEADEKTYDITCPMIESYKYNTFYINPEKKQYYYITGFGLHHFSTNRIIWYNLEKQTIDYSIYISFIPQYIISFAVNSDNTLIAVKDRSKVTIWNINTGLCINTLPQPTDEPYYQLDNFVAFSPDSTLIKTYQLTQTIIDDNIQINIFDIGEEMRTRRRLAYISRELIATACHPRRVIDWCWDIEEQRDFLLQTQTLEN